MKQLLHGAPSTPETFRDAPEPSKMTNPTSEPHTFQLLVGLFRSGKRQPKIIVKYTYHLWRPCGLASALEEPQDWWCFCVKRRENQPERPASLCLRPQPSFLLESQKTGCRVGGKRKRRGNQPKRRITDLKALTPKTGPSAPASFHRRVVTFQSDPMRITPLQSRDSLESRESRRESCPPPFGAAGGLRHAPFFGAWERPLTELAVSLGLPGRRLEAPP